MNRCLLLLVALLVAATPSHADDWRELYEDAAQAQVQRKYKEARRLLEEALELAAEFAPTDWRYPATVAELAQTLRLQGKPARALELFDEELADLAGDPRGAPLLNKMATEYRAQRQASAAERTWLRVISLVENEGDAASAEAHGEALRSLAELYDEKNRLPEAIELLEQLGQLRAGDPRHYRTAGHHRLARLYVRNGNLEAGSAAYGRLFEAVAEKFDDGDRYLQQVRREYAEVLSRMGREDAAHTVLETRRASVATEDEADATNTIHVGGMNGVTTPRLIKRVTPTYPELQRKKKIAAEVELKILVDRDGNVRATEVITCSKPGLGFEDEAQRVVKLWQYAAATKDGIPVDVYHNVTISFRARR